MRNSRSLDTVVDGLDESLIVQANQSLAAVAAIKNNRLMAPEHRSTLLQEICANVQAAIHQVEDEIGDEQPDPSFA